MNDTTIGFPERRQVKRLNNVTLSPSLRSRVNSAKGLASGAQRSFAALRMTGGKRSPGWRGCDEAMDDCQVGTFRYGGRASGDAKILRCAQDDRGEGNSG